MKKRYIGFLLFVLISTCFFTNSFVVSAETQKEEWQLTTTIELPYEFSRDECDYEINIAENKRTEEKFFFFKVTYTSVCFQVRLKSNASETYAYTTKEYKNSIFGSKSLEKVIAKDSKLSEKNVYDKILKLGALESINDAQGYFEYTKKQWTDLVIDEIYEATPEVQDLLYEFIKSAYGIETPISDTIAEAKSNLSFMERIKSGIAGIFNTFTNILNGSLDALLNGKDIDADIVNSVLQEEVNCAAEEIFNTIKEVSITN